MRKPPIRLGWVLPTTSALILVAILGFSPRASAFEAMAETATVNVLDAQKAGDLDLNARGAGYGRVKLTLANTSARRLNIILPPGLVAAAGTGQGFQSMGLGLPTSQPGRFGGDVIRSGGSGPGFRSVSALEPGLEGVAVSPGQSIELFVPAVCLDFGLPTPTAKDTFQLMSVDEFTNDDRARKALRSLAELGTSLGVAQAVVWKVFNDVPYEQMSRKASRYLNGSEISLASRFVEALDVSGTQESIDSAYFQEGRVLVHLNGPGSLGKVASRLGDELQGSQILGLPAQVVETSEVEQARPATLLVEVVLEADVTGRVGARALLRYNAEVGGWTRLGGLDLGRKLDVNQLNGEALADVLDRSLAQKFVSMAPAHRSSGSTTFQIVNKLPFTIEDVVVRTGRDDDAPQVSLEGLGVGPFRNARASIPAPTGQVERVVLNGL